MTPKISLGTNREVRTLISKLCEKLQRDLEKKGVMMVADPGSNGVFKPEGKDMQSDFHGLRSYCLSSEHR